MIELSIAEAAERIGITKIALRNKVSRGTVAAIKGEDGQWRVQVEERNDVWVAIPANGQVRPRRYTSLHDRDIQRDTQSPPVSIDPGRRAEQLTVVQEILAPFIVELGTVREELGRERGQREHAERERDELRARLAASEDNPPMQSAPVAPGGAQREPEASWRVRLRRWMGWG